MQPSSNQIFCPHKLDTMGVSQAPFQAQASSLSELKRHTILHDVTVRIGREHDNYDAAETSEPCETSESIESEFTTFTMPFCLLYARSKWVQRECSTGGSPAAGRTTREVRIPSLPGGSAAFEMVADFCYGLPVIVADNDTHTSTDRDRDNQTSDAGTDTNGKNVSVLRLLCCASFLEMTYECGEGNLEGQLWRWFQSTDLADGERSLRSLESLSRDASLLGEAEKMDIPRLASECVAGYMHAIVEDLGAEALHSVIERIALLPSRLLSILLDACKRTGVSFVEAGNDLAAYHESLFINPVSSSDPSLPSSPSTCSSTTTSSSCDSSTSDSWRSEEGWLPLLEYACEDALSALQWQPTTGSRSSSSIGSLVPYAASPTSHVSPSAHYLLTLLIHCSQAGLEPLTDRIITAASSAPSSWSRTLDASDLHHLGPQLSRRLVEALLLLPVAAEDVGERKKNNDLNLHADLAAQLSEIVCQQIRHVASDMVSYCELLDWMPVVRAINRQQNGSLGRSDAWRAHSACLIDVITTLGERFPNQQVVDPNLSAALAELRKMIDFKELTDDQLVRAIAAWSGPASPDFYHREQAELILRQRRALRQMERQLDELKKATVKLLLASITDMESDPEPWTTLESRGMEPDLGIVVVESAGTRARLGSSLLLGLAPADSSLSLASSGPDSPPTGLSPPSWRLHRHCMEPHCPRIARLVPATMPRAESTLSLTMMARSASLPVDVPKITAGAAGLTSTVPVVSLRDLPGGAASFAVVARWCYGAKSSLTP